MRKHTVAMGLALMLGMTAVWCQAPGRHLTMGAAIDLALLQRPDLKEAPTPVPTPKPAPSSSASPAAASPTPSPNKEHAPPAPSLSFTAIATNFQTVFGNPPSTRDSGRSLLPGTAIYDENLYVGMPVYSGVRLGQKPDAEKMAEEVWKQEKKAEVADIVRSTRIQFLKAILARDETSVYQEIVDKETDASQMAQSQFEGGKVPQAVAFRARMELASGQQRLNDAKGESAKALMDLKLACGLDQSVDVVLDGDFSEQPQTVAELSALLQTAVKQRPDLLGALILLPADLRLRADTLRQVVRRDVYKANADVQTQLDNLNLTASAVEAASENYRIAHLRFETGRGIQLELLDALAALQQARLDRTHAAYGYQAALAELSWAVGSSDRQ